MLSLQKIKLNLKEKVKKIYYNIKNNIIILGLIPVLNNNKETCSDCEIVTIIKNESQNENVQIIFGDFEETIKKAEMLEQQREEEEIRQWFLSLIERDRNYYREHIVEYITNVLQINIDSLVINYSNIFIYSILFSIIVLLYNIIYYSKIINTVFSIAIIFFLSGLYFAYIGAEFLGLIIILIYVGAILVLFLFFIMIVDIKKTNINVNMYKNIIVLYTLFLFFLILIDTLYSNFDNIIENSINTHPYFYNNNLEVLGLTLYNKYGILIMEAGIILLVAMIGIIILNIKKVENKKTQNILRQVLNIKK